MYRSTPLLALCFLSLGSKAQVMTFGGGTLTIAPGTTLELVGPITWQLAGDAQVVNNGHVDLGEQASLEETVGSPITGTGTETATWAVPGAMAGVGPGGLGLTITSSYAAGGMEVERGHVPVSGPNATTSIARWYRTSTPVVNTADMDVVLRYDPTELNGILPASLSLFVASGLVGPWNAVATIGNQPTAELMGTDPASMEYITAFDLDIATQMASAPGTVPIRVWPTLFTDVINVALPQGMPMERLELMDATGRSVPLPLAGTASSDVAIITVPPLPGGAYVLRVNGKSAYRLVHP